MKTTNKEARELFGARNKREAKRTAMGLASSLIDAYLGEGQPHQDAVAEGVPTVDADRLRSALVELSGRLRRNTGD